MNQPLATTIKSLLSPVSTLERSDASHTLGSVLSLVESSHDAVLIFDQDRYLGVVAPYQVIYASNYPYTTKVASVAFKTPPLTEDSPIYEAAERMLATKIYNLPVNANDQAPDRVIQVKDILSAILKDQELLEFVSQNIQRQAPITALITADSKDIFQALKQRGISRMILVDTEGSLAGIVTRSDLLQGMIEPTPRMRFPHEGSHRGRASYAGEKKFRMEEPIRKYATTKVDALPDTAAKDQIITHLITSTHNSLVLVNGDNRPTGFLSTRDLLRALAQLRPTEDLPFIIKRPSNSVTDQEYEEAIEHLERFGHKLNQRMGIEKIELSTEEPKSPVGQTSVFNTTLIVTPVAGRSIVAATKQRRFLDAVLEATDVIEKQRRRSGASKEETNHAIA